MTEEITGAIHIRDLQEDLVQARNRIDGVIEKIDHCSIVGEISRPLQKKQRKPRKSKTEKVKPYVDDFSEKPKRRKSPPDTQTGII